MQNFKITDTNFEGLKIINSFYAPDHRGGYQKIFEKNIFLSSGLPVVFGEFSNIYSKKGALRGLHYQTKDSQGKLINVLKGKIFDVALDLRKESSTFGQWISFILDGNDKKAIYIPEGFAHGFLTMEDDTIFSYQCTGKYRPEFCGGIKWDDKDLNIDWPLAAIDEVILSEKDKNWPSFREYVNNIKR